MENNQGGVFVDGQKIQIADLQWPEGWVLQTATIRKDAGDDQFHIEFDSGAILWGVTTLLIQQRIDGAVALLGSRK